MNKVEIKFKIITPMFSFGNNKLEAEFRVTELKSLMRNTFRELYYFKDIKDMKEKEVKLFGNTEKKSPLSFKADIKDVHTGNRHMLPHDKRALTKCLDSSSEIILHMIVNDVLILEFYINLLILSSIFGSLGKRSRKGFGSFKIINIKNTEKNKYKKYNELLKKNPIEILNNFTKQTNNLCKMRNYSVEKQNNSINLEFNKHNINFPYTNKVHVLKIHKNNQKKNVQYNDLLKDISQLTQNRLSDSFTKKIINSDINKSILGNYKSSRFASPIWVSFWENDTDSYMIIKELNYCYILKEMYVNMCIKKSGEKNYNKKRILIQNFKKDYKQGNTEKNFRQDTKKYINKYINELINKGGYK